MIRLMLRTCIAASVCVGFTLAASGCDITALAKRPHDAGLDDDAKTLDDTPAADAPAADAPIADAPTADAPTADALAPDVAVVDAPDVDEADAPIDTPVVEPDAVDDAVADVASADVVRDAGPVTTYVATLQGVQAVPPVYGTASSGSATLTLSADRATLSWSVTHTLPSPTAGHIHAGLAGTRGAIVASFALRAGVLTGAVTLTPAQADALAQGRMYVDLHTQANPNGELRGQITLPGERLWVARLGGAQEVPPVTTTAEGRAQLLVAEANDRVRYIVETTAAPTFAHVRTAPGGANGLITLDVAGAAPSMTMAGTAAVSTAAVANDLINGRWYINVDTAAHASGELRGQVLRPGEVLYTATLSGASEVPPVVTVATGALAVILSGDRATLTCEGVMVNIAPTAANLYTGAPGMNGNVVASIPYMGATLRGAVNVPATPSDFIARLDASGIYANVRSASSPGGQLRGQLLPR